MPGVAVVVVFMYVCPWSLNQVVFYLTIYTWRQYNKRACTLDLYKRACMLERQAGRGSNYVYTDF